MLASISRFWNALDLGRRVVLVLGAVAIVAAIYGIGRVATAPPMALLYSGLEPTAAGEVVRALEERRVSFEVRGDSIYVAADRRDQTRMALAAEGLPASGAAGYELLDGLSGFGTTSQMFDAAYWRAKEGELARTITASANVRAARVHIANPSPQPFVRNSTTTAAVTVTMARGELDGNQARAIRYLVSSAVAGLAPEAVSVIDSASGVVLASGQGDAGESPEGDGASRTEVLKRNIEQLLEARVGPGRAVVQVAVDTDMQSQTITERLIDPDSRTAISSEIEQSRESRTGRNPGVTVASNLPDGDAAEASDSAREANQSRERTNFEISETRRERVIRPGEVRRISVAVLVDGITRTDASGETVWEPRPEAELAQLQDLVEAAVGFDEARGDVVTIRSMQFSMPLADGAVVERAGESFASRHGALLAQIGILAAIVLALLFFVVRPMLRRPAAQAAPELDEAESQPQIAALAPAEEEASAPALPEVEKLLELPPSAGRKIERLREVVARRSDESAAVLRGWIETSEAGSGGVR